MNIHDIDTKIFDGMVTDYLTDMYESQYDEPILPRVEIKPEILKQISEKKDKCPKGFLGDHKWITEKRLTGAGKIFVYKLDPPVCEYCGKEKK